MLRRYGRPPSGAAALSYEHVATCYQVDIVVVVRYCCDGYIYAPPTCIAVIYYCRSRYVAPRMKTLLWPPDATLLGLSHWHRTRGTGGQVPHNLEYDANRPPQILSYMYKKERSVAFKIRPNPLSAGALPRTPLGELTTLPRPSSLHTIPLGTDSPSALAMRPRKIPAGSTPMVEVQCDRWEGKKKETF